MIRCIQTHKPNAMRRYTKYESVDNELGSDRECYDRNAKSCAFKQRNRANPPTTWYAVHPPQRHKVNIFGFLHVTSSNSCSGEKPYPDVVNVFHILHAAPHSHRCALRCLLLHILHECVSRRESFAK